MEVFKINATEKNLQHTRSFTPAYDGSGDAYCVGNAIAKIKGCWIKFYGNYDFQETKKGFLKYNGYLD